MASKLEPQHYERLADLIDTGFAIDFPMVMALGLGPEASHWVADRLDELLDQGHTAAQIAEHLRAMAREIRQGEDR